MDLAAARERLAADRDATVARIQVMTADLAAVAAASAGSNLDDEHDPEGSTVAFEREQLAAVRSAARQHLDEIEAAIGRLDAGSYGSCLRCRRPISDERLAVLPAARLCVTCASGRRR